MMPVKESFQIEVVEVKAGDGVTKQVLISTDEGPNFAMRRFVIQPGGGMPKHANLVEHEQYVLRGQAKIGIGDQVYEVTQDDVVFIPAEVPHWYRNEGDEPFEFLCLVPNLPDETRILDE